MNCGYTRGLFIAGLLIIGIVNDKKHIKKRSKNIFSSRNVHLELMDDFFNEFLMSFEWAVIFTKERQI